MGGKMCCHSVYVATEGQKCFAILWFSLIGNNQFGSQITLISGQNSDNPNNDSQQTN